VGAQTNAVQYVWEGWALLAVLDAAGNLLESYTRGVGVAYDVGSLVAVHHHDGAYTNETIYLHNNHRGDVTTVRSGTNTLATYRYSAYGSVRQHSGIYECRLGFSSKELDAPVGFLYFGFRFCDPRMARWLSKDPIGVAGGLNQYEAFANCPLNSLDPLALCDHGGKSSWIPAAIIGGMFPKSGLNQMKHLWSQMSSLNAYMKNFPKGSVAWRAFNAELTSMYARYTATHGATYTAGGSLTGYGALGLTRWGSGLSIRAIGGLAAGTAVVGGVIGHEISQIEIGGGQTVAEVVGGGLYRITPGLWNRLGRLWW
jgi:RHS repeat-associated protein